MGHQAGFNLTIGNYNIDIGNPGVAGESSTIRIGTPGIHTNTLIAGVINGNGGGLTNLPVGGSGNTIQGGATLSFIGGGLNNAIQTNAAYSTIGGGYINTIQGQFDSIGGGAYNVVTNWSGVIAGGSYNTNFGYAAAIGGGDHNIATGPRAVIAGGVANSALIGEEISIGGGVAAVIAGGNGNTNLGYASAIGGGQNNFASGAYAALAGGVNNRVTGDYSAVVGGLNNSAGGQEAVVAGGFGNTAGGNYSFAAGSQAMATNQGALVWADSQPAPFGSTTMNQFNVRANGGVRLVTGGAGMALDGQPVLNAASVVAANQLAGNYTNALMLNNLANQFTGSYAGNGAGVTNVNAATLGGLTAASFWKLGGNSGSNPGTDFIGTPDNQALEFRVNGLRALRLEPNTSGAPNVIGGSSNNFAGGWCSGRNHGGWWRG